MKIVVIGTSSKSLINFRLDMMLTLRKNGFHVTACAPKDDYFDETRKILERKNINLMDIYIQNTTISLFKDLKTLISFYRVLKRLQPTHVFNYHIKPVVYGSLIAKIVGCKTIISMITGLGHLYTFEDWRTRFLRKIANTLYKLAFMVNRAVLFQNQDDRDLFLKLKLLPPQKTSLVAGSGVNLTEFPLTPLPTTMPLKFIFIGRLLVAKGIKEYCQAAALLHQKYPQTQFQVLGGFHTNPSAIETTELHQRFSQADIIYLGEKESVLESIQESHVVVLPSYREGTPKVLLEALAVGRPLITTDTPGCRETVRLGKNGFLVPIQDTASLAHAMEYFIQNPQKIASMGKESRKLAEEKFDVTLVNQTILELM
jgi:glycosyltransferase involved in cell wall biosynthesis